MKKHKAVIGLGFGDEGKGLVTDYLCSQTKNPLVVRFSGGHQVGHTVVNDITAHIFSNFGSGTLQDIPTYWSKFCTVEPMGLLKELEVLRKKGCSPKLYIDAKCPITTPYDIDYNQGEKNNLKHGSVGVGYGVTLQREENFYSLLFEDLFYPTVFEEKLRLIKEYYKSSNNCEFFENIRRDIVFNESIEKVYTIPKDYNYIFEGSQGLLLDQHFGFFPNVTRSNTGTKNIFKIMKNIELDLYLVTRAYQTRHGNGFMTNGGKTHNIIDNIFETNKTNIYQGEFRKSLLDVLLLEYAISKDDYIRNSDNKNLVITCLDQIKEQYEFSYAGIQRISLDNENDFVNRVAKILKIKNMLLSKNNNSKNIKKIIAPIG